MYTKRKEPHRQGGVENIIAYNHCSIMPSSELKSGCHCLCLIFPLKQTKNAYLTPTLEYPIYPFVFSPGPEFHSQLALIASGLLSLSLISDLIQSWGEKSPLSFIKN